MNEPLRRRLSLALLGTLLVPSAFGAACGVRIPSMLDFGLYDTLATRAPAGWTFQVECSRTHPGNSPDSVMLTVTFSSGSGSFATRTLTSGTQTLHYNLYADSAHTQVLGDGSAGTVKWGPVAIFLTGPALRSSVTGLVYGLLPGGQSVSPGRYQTRQPVVVTLAY